jgi:predicted CoA-binding protein
MTTKVAMIHQKQDRFLSAHDPAITSLPASVVAAVAAVDFAAAPTLEQQKKLFLSAAHFAVVGASRNDTKNGSKVGDPLERIPAKSDNGMQALGWLVKQKKEVIPINLNAPEIQGIKCKKSLSELADPTHTSVVIVVPPKVGIISKHFACTY